jgi:hypothetical protein
MSAVSSQSVALLRRVAEFLDGLPEDQILDLAEGRARLTYVPWGATEPAPVKVARLPRKAAAPSVDVEAILAGLDQADSRDAGRELLDPLNVTALRAIAKAAGMTGVSKTPKPELVDQLVALTIGGRLGFAAMREG